MDPDIRFTFDGKSYTVASTAYEKPYIVLPDGRLLEASEGWLESYPPIPQGLVEVGHLLKDKDPEEIAALMNGVVAEEIQETTEQ